MSEADVTRRRLLRRGGAAAGAAALSGIAAQNAGAKAFPARAKSGELPAGRPPNIVLILADRMRADALKVYDDVLSNNGHTPNLDAFAKSALRFKYATPESMPAIPVRRSLLTGMRSYPFRDWVAVRGVPAIPGWHKIYDFQPLLPELTKANGIETVYVTDNPLLAGPRFDFVRRTQTLPRSTSYTSDERSYLLPLRKAPERREPTQRVMKAGTKLLDELKGKQPFFLGLDAMNPVDAFDMPRQYTMGEGPVVGEGQSAQPDQHTYINQIHVDPTDGLADTVRERYGNEMTAVDTSIGDFLHQLDAAGLADDTVVIVAGDSGIALGEQGVFGHVTGIWHRRTYQVPLMIRDPRRRWAGDTSSWYASTYDIPPTILSYLGIVIPGKMDGEDLTTLFDDDNLPPRPHFTSMIDSHVVAGDKEWLLIGRIDDDRWRLYHLDDTDKPDDIENKTVTAPTILSGLRRDALVAAGSTWPRFGATKVIRPLPPLEQTDAIADDGTLDSDDRDANRLGG